MAPAAAAVGAQVAAGAHRAAAAGARRGGDRRTRRRLSAGSPTTSRSTPNGLPDSSPRRVRRSGAATPRWRSACWLRRRWRSAASRTTVCPIRRAGGRGATPAGASGGGRRGSGRGGTGAWLRGAVHRRPRGLRAGQPVPRAGVGSADASLSTRPVDPLTPSPPMAVPVCCLAAELGIEPGPALRDIEQAILTHDRRLLNSSVRSLRVWVRRTCRPR